MASNRFSAVSMAALVVGMALFGTAAFAGSAAAASNGSIEADPADPGVTSTHTITLTAGEATAGSWNGLEVDYSQADANVTNNVDVGNVKTEHIEVIRIDRADDQSGTSGDVNVRDDVSSVSTSNNGETLTVGLGGAYELNAGDEVILVVDNVINPEPAGEYEVALDINPQSSGGQGTAMLNIGDTSASEDTTTTETTTTTASESTTTTTADGGDTTTTTASGGTPGFGVGAALVALLAAGALLTRRNE